MKEASGRADWLAEHTPHVPELQSIRGLAALAVLIGHCIAYYATPSWWTFVKRLLNGQADVEVFFVLSGFVLTLSLIRKPMTRPGMIAYYVKRGFRIYPALVVASAFAMAYVFGLHYQIPVPGASQWIGERFRADRFSVLYITASFAGMLAFLIPPVWTIFIEITASIMLPGIAYLLAFRRWLFWVTFGVLVLISVGFGGLLYYRIDMYLMDFALGASLLAINPEPLRRLIARGLPIKPILFLAALLFVCTRAFTNVDTWDSRMQVYEALFAAFMIFGFGRAGVRSVWLRSRVAVWIGDISYSVYLLHFTVMCLMAKVIALLAPGFVVAQGGIVAGLVLCVPTIAITLPLASLSFRYIEKPGIALGSAVVRWLARSGAMPAKA